LDHNETECATKFNGDCTYVIAIVNPSTEHGSFYQITASHS
jgi:hypothetical protein